MKTRAVPTVKSRMQSIVKKNPSAGIRLAEMQLFTAMLQMAVSYGQLDNFIPDELRLYAGKPGLTGAACRTFGEELRAMADLSDRIDYAQGMHEHTQNHDGSPANPLDLYPHLRTV